ncbi:MAG: SusC/RagA family TonB-linked outer membrane protein, partial [Bacteroidota bacterium]
LPASSGFSNEVRNDLDLRNTGIEIALNTNPVRSENVTWNSTLNFWFNRTEVTRLGVPGFVPPGVAFGLGLGTFFVDQGQPITALFGNGESGPEQIGNVEPDFQMGWYNSLNIGKNLDVNFLLHWKQGGDILNLTRLLTNIGGTTPEENLNIEGFIEDGTYLRLREIGAFYRIPVASDFIDNVKLGVSGRNLLTLTQYSSYDPEVSTKGTTGLSQGIEVTPFPSSKQVYFHVSLNF